jgi:hypothetical protein
VDIRVEDVQVGAAEVVDNRARPPFRIQGPGARVWLEVDGRPVVVDVAPLEILEFRARIGDAALLHRSARETAVALAIRLVQTMPSPDGYRLIAPQVAEVHADEAAAWRQIFAIVDASGVVPETATSRA